MAYKAGELAAELSLNMNQFSSGLKKAAAEAKKLGTSFRDAFKEASTGSQQASNAIKGAQRDFKDFERIVGGILLSQAFYGGVAAIKDASSAVVEFKHNMEKAQIALEYFLESPEAAKGFMASMKDFAATTAFSTEQALVLSRRLMAAQFDPTQVRGIMEILNDASVASGGTADQLDRIVLAITQISTNGKVKGQELRQLAEANIPIYQILHEQLGIAKEELLDIGRLNIDGDIGVTAILQGLQKRYEGAAERIAQTVPGMMETIKDDALILGEVIIEGPYRAMEGMIRNWRDTLEKARAALDKGGLGQVLEDLVPKELQTSVRLVVGSVKSLVVSFKTLAAAIKPAVEFLGGMFVQALGVIMPILAGVMRVISSLAHAAITAVPPIKFLTAAIIGLLIGQAVTKSLLFLWNVMRLGVVASVVANAVRQLATAIQFLYAVMTRNPIVAVIMIIAGALLYLALSSKTVIQWLDNLMAKLGALGGFNIGEVLQPGSDDNLDDWFKHFNQEVQGINDNLQGVGQGLEDIGDDAKKSGKKIKDSFIAAFDEVYAVPEKQDPAGGAGAMPGFGDLGMPDFGDLGKTIIDELPRVIELPEFKINMPDLTPLIQWLGKPFKFNFKIDWPKIPPPPPAFVTAWEFSMNAIRAALKGLEFSLEWLKGLIPNLVPQLFPQGVMGPVLERVREWGTQTKGVFDELKQRLEERWGSAWQALQAATGAALVSMGIEILANTASWVAPVIGALEAIGQGILTQAVQWGLDLAHGLSVMQGAWETFTGHLANLGVIMWEALKLAWSHGLELMKEWASNALDWMKNLWDNHKWTILAILGAIALAIVTVLTGGLAGAIAAILGWLARLAPLLARLGPMFQGAIRAIPTFFANIFNKLPLGAQTVITRIVDAFKALPGRIMDMIKNIPSQVAGIFGKIKLPSFSSVAQSAANAVGGIFSKPVTGFAKGGVIDKDSIVRVGEGGRREAIVPMDDGSAMAPFADAVAQRLQGAMGGNNNNQQPEQDDRPIIHVGTLIADERSLRELERRMQVVRKNEGLRGAEV